MKVSKASYPGMSHHSSFLPGLLLAASLCVSFSAPAASSEMPAVSPPPESFFELVPSGKREKARAFYKKYIDIGGLPVAASGDVADEALRRTHWIVRSMLAGRPDMVEQMRKDGMYLVIIGKDQVYTDIPEYSDNPDPAFVNERVRGTGGKPTSFGEENLLSLPIDRYDDESIAVHEFCHTIDSTLGRMDPDWRSRKNQVYRNALEKGLYKLSYAASNPAEYWAEICQAYFDCNRCNNWNHGPIGTREQLKVYDPEGYELVRTTFQLKPEQDWRYSWLQPLPNVTAPPAKFSIDPFFTKFTWARELPIIGRAASDTALLKANAIIRKMFAYRHDILKIFINNGTRLVILGPGEKLADLPQLRGRTDIDPLARFLEYTPEIKLIVVSEENLFGDPAEVGAGDSQIVRLFARALHRETANRPVDPNWNNRGGAVQQYELRVKRLDEEFGRKVNAIFESSREKGRWKGSAAANDAVSYWSSGVLAYFDATGQDGAPNDAPHPITTRELLRQYDPDLFALVHETMAYEGRTDWRLRHSSLK
jgi:hypothetical protein